MIDRNSIKEELRLVDDGVCDYVTPTGKIYCHYKDDYFFEKSVFVNKHNGYCYVNFKSNSKKKQIQRRVHILVAIAYIPNVNKYPVVMHLDNNKINNCVNNLKWGTTRENTLQAFRDGLARNDVSFEDSQSIAVVELSYDKKEVVKIYGSISEASKSTGLTKTGIIYQCDHKIKSKPRCQRYFRYLDEYINYGFIL